MTCVVHMGTQSRVTRVPSRPSAAGQACALTFAAMLAVACGTSTPSAEASPSGAAISGNTLYVAALKGERLWLVPLKGGAPTSELTGRYGYVGQFFGAPGTPVSHRAEHVAVKLHPGGVSGATVLDAHRPGNQGGDAQNNEQPAAP